MRRTANRLLLAFMLVAATGAFAASAGLHHIGELAQRADGLYEEDLLGLAYLKEANVNLNQVGRSLRGALLARYPQDKRQLLVRAQTALTALKTNVHLARPRFTAERGRELMGDLEVQVDAFAPLVGSMLQRADSASQDAAVGYLFERVMPQANRLDDLIAALEREKQAKTRLSLDGFKDCYEAGRRQMFLFAALIASIGAACVLVFGRSLRPVAR